MPGTPPTSPRFGAPRFDNAVDAADFAGGVNRVVDNFDLNAARDAQGTLAARPAAGIRGRYYFATDNGFLYRDTGTAWVNLTDLVGWEKTGVGTAGLADQAFGYYRETDYSAGVGERVKFNTLIYNNGATFATTGTFTCTRAGSYEFNATVAFPSSTPAAYRAQLLVGPGLGLEMDEDSSAEFIRLHGVRQMDVGDAAWVALLAAGTVRGGRRLTHFHGRMIGR